MPTIEDIMQQKREELQIDEEQEYNPFDPYRFGWCGVALGAGGAGGGEPGIVGSGMDDIAERTGMVPSDGDIETIQHTHTYLKLTDTNDTYSGFNNYFPKVDGSSLKFSKILDSDVPSILTKKTYRSNKREAFVLLPYGAGTGETGELRFKELLAGGINYVGFKAPDSIASNNIYAIPDAFPTANAKVLASTTAGVMSWVSVDGIDGYGGTELEDDIRYLDNFADASLHWTWAERQTSGTDRYVTEADGVLTISIANTKHGEWTSAVNNAPKVLVGIPGYPVTIITKLNSYTVNNETRAGLFIGYNAAGTGGGTVVQFTRFRRDSLSINGFQIVKLAVSTDYTDSVTTLPMWLRAKITGEGYTGSKIIFGYSTDGITYTDLHTYNDYPSYGGMGLTVGLFANNINASYNAIDAPFEYVSITRNFGPG